MERALSGFNKVVTSYADAIAGIADNMTVMIGGFGLCGIPEGLIAAVHEQEPKGLTCISNNAGIDGFGLGLWLNKRQILKKTMFSFDLLIVLYCVIYLVLIIRILKKAKLKNPKLNIKKWFLSESISIPGFLIFSLMMIRLLMKLF